MNYILKQFDEPLVKFSATTDTSEPETQIVWTNEEKAALLPLDLTLTPDGVSRWKRLRRRTIPNLKSNTAPRSTKSRQFICVMQRNAKSLKNALARSAVNSFFIAEKISLLRVFSI